MTGPGLRWLKYILHFPSVLPFLYNNNTLLALIIRTNVLVYILIPCSWPLREVILSVKIIATNYGFFSWIPISENCHVPQINVVCARVYSFLCNFTILYLFSLYICCGICIWTNTWEQIAWAHCASVSNGGLITNIKWVFRCTRLLLVSVANLVNFNH